ncbi:MAG TPA: efflux RND transporter permease subunit [Gemmatimonadota bacterium]|nr:efflux RND transporter permease subunit [Gemmatimonadota bacterium]
MIGFAVRRPLAVVMGLGSLAALGIPSAWRMPVGLLPEVDFPRLEVSTDWPGASPEQVEMWISSPVEAAAHEVGGARSVRSVSWAGRSAVTVEFEPGKDMEFARLELAERLAALATRLPVGSRRPEIEWWVPDALAEAAWPLLVYTLAGPVTAGALREYAEQELVPGLSAVRGVGAVEVLGGTRREIRVRLDPERMAALGIELDAVRRALRSDLDLVDAGGLVRRRDLAFTVAIVDGPEEIADLEALVVEPGSSRGPPVRLGQIARVALTYAEPTELQRLNGDPAVTLDIRPLPGANAIATVDRVRERLGALAGRLPEGYRVVEDHDGSERIRDQVGGLRDRGLASIACVLLVLLAAFRRWPPALLVLGTIAASLLVTIDLMALAGLSLNLLTLAGLAMGIGLIDDNAIVVLEAIEARTAALAPSRREQGMVVRTAARQVVHPLIAASVTNLIVFVPFLYLQGDLRAYYVPFAMTVGLALLASLGVAFSLVPALAPRVSSPGNPEHVTRRAGVPGGAPRLRDLYRRAILRSVAHPRATVAAAFLLLAVSGWLFREEVPQGRTFAGLGDQDFVAVQITMPPGAGLDRTDEVARRIEARLSGQEQVDRYATRVGPGHASIHLAFPDSLTATGEPAAVRERLAAHARTIGGAVVGVYGFGPGFHGAGGGPPRYGLGLKGYDYRELDRLMGDLAGRLERYPRIRDVDPDRAGHWFDRQRETELVLVPDRSRLAAYGLPVADFVGRVAARTGGGTARGAVTLAGEPVDLSLAMSRVGEPDVEALLDLTLEAPTGTPLRVADVGRVRGRSTTGAIVREDQQYQRIVTYEFRGPRKLGDRVRDGVVAATALPPGFELETGRSFWEYEEGEKAELALVVALAVALVYMVTAALFESLRAPLVVLGAVPLALIGVFLLHVHTRETFTRESWIGVVMMAGIVVNNAILVVDRIGTLRRGGEGPALGLQEAAVRGTLDRVRPILMTTGTTVLGLLPLVLFGEPGTQGLWRTLALATMGGLVASTLLVLVTLPALYVVVNPKPAHEDRRLSVHPATR